MIHSRMHARKSLVFCIPTTIPHHASARLTHSNHSLSLPRPFDSTHCLRTHLYISTPLTKPLQPRLADTFTLVRFIIPLCFLSFRVYIQYDHPPGGSAPRQRGIILLNDWLGGAPSPLLSRPPPHLPPRPRQHLVLGSSSVLAHSYFFMIQTTFVFRRTVVPVMKGLFELCL